MASTHLVIDIDSGGSAAIAAATHGNKIQWRAPSHNKAWIDPPDIFTGGCATGNIITLHPGEIGPSPACVVTGGPGSYYYGCGVGDPPVGERIFDGGEIIIIDGLTHPKKH